MAHRHFLVLTLSALMTGLPLTGEAVQISPNPNPIGSTIDIVNDPSAVNANFFLNSGTIAIDSTSTLTNQATLANIGNGRINNNGGTIVNNSQMSNAGGQLTNTGLLQNNGGLSATTFNSTISNSGSLVNASASGITLNDKARLDNTGTLINEGQIQLDEGLLHNSGTMTNSGTIQSFNNAGFFDNGGQFTNAGTVNVTNLGNSGIINNDGSIIIKDSVFTGRGDYSQASGQTINNGMLTLFHGAVNIQGGSLSGLGTITTPTLALSSGATLSPGTATQLGTLTLNGNLQSSGNLHFRIGGLNAGEFDVLKVNGNASFTGGNLLFQFANGFHAAIGNSWTFLTTSALSGWNSLLVSIQGLMVDIDYKITSANGAQTLTIVRVPEPSSFLLLGLGLAGLVGFRRKLTQHTNKD